MPILDARELRKSLGSRTLLDGVFLTIDEGERIGLVGANGCGKSTLARILAGIDPADGGELAKQRGANIVYLAQEPVFEGDPTALDAVLSGLSEWQLARTRHAEASEALANAEDSERWMAQMEDAAHQIERLGGWDREHEARSFLQHLGMTRLDARIGTMSGGERRRVALARILVANPDLAILDEPTNHLDVEAIEWLERHLATAFRGAVLLVTHDRWFLNQVVTRTLELERGQLLGYEGGWEEYLEAKAERAAHERRHEQNRQNLLRRELDWLRRTPAARTGKQKARIQRAEHVIADIPAAREKRVELQMDTMRTGRTILELHGLRLEIGGRCLIDGFDLSLTKGERIGVIGPNGCGKSTLLRAILGELEPSRGRVVRGVNTKIAYLEQHRVGLDFDKSVAENVAPHAREVEWAGRRIELVSYLERMLFDTDQQKQPVGALSGGERARVLLAKMLLEPANLLILDEPTNDLDAPTLAALEEMLVEFDGTALVVTHDRWFLERIATAIIAFEGDAKVRRWAGGYSTWRALSSALEDEQAASAPSTSKPEASKNRSRPPKKGLSFTEKHELAGMMERITERESEIARLEAELADPAIYMAHGADVPTLLASLEQARESLAKLVARWEELETKSSET